MNYSRTICQMHWSGTEEWRANARAIAAVPKLVKALEDLLGHWDAFTEQGTTFGNQERAYYCLAKGAQDTWKQAREALAAATTPEED
jgi:hypothetical protein